MVPRGGLEGQTAESQGADTQTKGAPEKSPPPAGTSQNPEQLCSELSEIVSAWPKLPPDLRNAILTFLRIAKS